MIGNYYEIWIGKYHLGQGYDPPTEPQLVAVIFSTSFKLACYEYETLSKLESIIRAKNSKEDIHTYHSYYDPQDISNSWTGKYYSSKEEALKSFK